MLGKLCRCVNQSLLSFFRTATGLKTGVLGVVMAIQTFGDYARWHPHVHVLLADGLFRAKVLAMLNKDGRIDDAPIANLLTWRQNSGVSMHRGPVGPR